MKKNSKFKKYVSVLTVGAMVITSFNMPFAQTESKAAGYGISSPRIEKDVLISGDASEKPEGTISNPVVKADVTTWDCITFGNYWQEDTNGDGKIMSWTVNHIIRVAKMLICKTLLGKIVR